MRRLFTFVFVFSLIWPHPVWALQVDDGRTIIIHYTVTSDGEIVDSSDGDAPLEYLQGDPSVLPLTFQKNLHGLKVGDSHTFKLSPEEAYGPVLKDAVMKLPRQSLPPDPYVQVGSFFTRTAENGQLLQGKVLEMNKKTVTLDYNHPLAGKTLQYQVRIVDIR